MPRSEEGGAGRKAAGRLRRLLLVVPYLVRHPGSTIDELTNLFSVSRRDLLQDLNLLFVSGLPPYGPGDLIGVAIEDGRVWIEMADYFARPLRLTRAEALALYLRGTALAVTPGLREATALASALRVLLRQREGVCRIRLAVQGLQQQVAVAKLPAVRPLRDRQIRRVVVDAGRRLLGPRRGEGHVGKREGGHA